jgi:serine/threonine-protein kinase
MIRNFLGAAALISLSLASASAQAGDAATAEALFREGRTLMEAGNYAAACPKLEESYAQDPATGTLLALGICEERAGRTASAWATYGEAAARAKRDGRSDREQAAREHMTQLEPKLSHLTIQVEPSAANLAGFSVKRDGREVGAGAWGTSVPIDPGEHVVEATAPGKLPFQAKIKVSAQADAQTVQVPALAVDPTASAAALGASSSAVSAPPLEAGSAKPAPLRTAGLIVGGAGIVTLGISGYFALHAKSLNADSNADGHCDTQNECDALGGSKRNDAKSAANGATVTVLAGSALTALGVTLFFVGRSKKEQPQAARLEALPVLGPSEAAMFLRGRF